MLAEILLGVLLVASAYVCLRMCADILYSLRYIIKKETSVEENHATNDAESSSKGGAPRKVAPENALPGGNRGPPV